MQVLSLDAKRTSARVRPRSSQDLWRLAELIEAGDTVTARTERKIRLADDAVTRKIMTLKIVVERTELQGELLRISGIVAEGTDDVPKGAHHSFTIAAHDELTIDKDWASWQIEKLQEEDSTTILVLLMDREEAVFAVLRREPEILGTIRGAVQKKGMDGGSPYWEELAQHLVEYAQRLSPKYIVVASPAFFKEYVMALLPPEIAKKTVGATISATGEAAMAELVRRPELKQVLEQERFSRESLLMDKLLSAIRSDKAAYGVREVLDLAHTGVLETALVSTSLLQSSRESGTYSSLREALTAIERTKGTVHVLDTSAADQLNKLGGVGGVKRW